MTYRQPPLLDKMTYNFDIIHQTKSIHLLYYLFFEVFFSFIRKFLYEKKNPLIPDKKHLHMLFFFKKKKTTQFNHF